MQLDVFSIELMEEEFVRYFNSRSLLYNLEPVGIGTEYVESLASYITRLANSHSISVIKLLKHIISPLIEKYHIKQELGRGVSNGLSILINSNSIVTLECVNALEVLTNRKDLILLTMLNWSGIFQLAMGVTRKQWCPKCFEDMKMNSSTIYEPLLWTLRDIKKCNIHKLELIDSCQTCNKKVPFFHGSSKTGFCPYCQSWLGSTNNRVSCNLTKEENLIDKNYRQLIKGSANVNYVPTKLFLSMYLKEVQAKLNIETKRKFARFLEIDNVTLTGWLTNKYHPRRKSVINLILKVEQTLYDAIYFGYLIDPFKMRLEQKEVVRISKTEYEKILLIASENRVVQSLKSISEKYGYTFSYTTRNYPDLSKKIIENYKKSTEIKKAEKKEKIRKVLLAALNETIPISLAKLGKMYNFSYQLANSNEPELSKLVISRYLTYKSEQKIVRINSLLEEVREVACELHNEGMFPYRTRIQKKLDRAIFLEKEIQLGWEKIIVDLGYDLKRYKSKP